MLAGEDQLAARNCATTTAAIQTGSALQMRHAIAPNIGLARAVQVLVVLVVVIVWAGAIVSPELAIAVPNLPGTAAKMSFV